MSFDLNAFHLCTLTPHTLASAFISHLCCEVLSPLIYRLTRRSHGRASPATGTPLDRIEYDEYVRITCNHGYMASDSAHAHGEACKVSYIRECQADGTLTNRCVPGPGADARRASRCCAE